MRSDVKWPDQYCLVGAASNVGRQPDVQPDPGAEPVSGAVVRRGQAAASSTVHWFVTLAYTQLGASAVPEVAPVDLKAAERIHAKLRRIGFYGTNMNEQAEMLASPVKVRELQRTLWAAAKQSSGRRFHVCMTVSAGVTSCGRRGSGYARIGVRPGWIVSPWSRWRITAWTTQRLVIGYGKPWLAGVVGPLRTGHALMLTRFARVIKVRAFPSRRVMVHADQRYYDPIGLPLPSKSFHHRLIPLVFARRRPGRRVSPVPNPTMCTCRHPYPGRTRQADPGPGFAGHGLRRDMSGSAPPL